MKSNPPNKQWEIMARRIFKINYFFRFPDYCNRMIPGGEEHHLIMSSYSKGYQRDLLGIYNKTKSHYSFTKDENIRGNDFLKKIGLKSNDKFICLIVRDAAYKKKFQPYLQDSKLSHRNSDIENYKLTAINLAKKGYWVFRMGKYVEKQFNNLHKMIYDYAKSQYRSDFLDIWLTANCHFCLSTSTGLDDVAKTFRLPLIHTDVIPIGNIMSGKKDLIVLPKYIKDKKNQKKLSLKEQIELNLMRFISDTELDQLNLEVLNNTPEEIEDITMEMVSRLNNTWIEPKNNQYLQNEFWKIMNEWKDFKKWHGNIHPRVSEAFLRKNSKWFLK
tara:strand:- start:6503 stop:7492 length:990 start_codon:yes stop_codon:yes gene_type:complete